MVEAVHWVDKHHALYSDHPSSLNYGWAHFSWWSFKNILEQWICIFKNQQIYTSTIFNRFDFIILPILYYFLSILLLLIYYKRCYLILINYFSRKQLHWWMTFSFFENWSTLLWKPDIIFFNVGKSKQKLPRKITQNRNGKLTLFPWLTKGRPALLIYVLSPSLYTTYTT